MDTIDWSITTRCQRWFTDCRHGSTPPSVEFLSCNCRTPCVSGVPEGAALVVLYIRGGHLPHHKGKPSDTVTPPGGSRRTPPPPRRNIDHAPPPLASRNTDHAGPTQKLQACHGPGFHPKLAKCFGENIQRLTIWGTDIGLKLGQRRRRWAKFKPTSVPHIVYAGEGSSQKKCELL